MDLQLSGLSVSCGDLIPYARRTTMFERLKQALISVGIAAVLATPSIRQEKWKAI
jgi:hypothetical protein